MRGRRRPAAATTARVDTIRKRIEDWRRTRQKRSPMPGLLWDEATRLARRQGVYAVARALGVNYESLKKRAGGSASAASRVEGPSESGFVELCAAPLFGASMLTAPTSSTVVEVADGRGVRLTIRLGGEAPLDVVGLVDAFASRRRRA